MTGAGSDGGWDPGKGRHWAWSTASCLALPKASGLASTKAAGSGLGRDPERAVRTAFGRGPCSASGWDGWTAFHSASRTARWYWWAARLACWKGPWTAWCWVGWTDLSTACGSGASSDGTRAPEMASSWAACWAGRTGPCWATTTAEHSGGTTGLWRVPRWAACWA